jgi:hypothetical protein
MSFRSPKLLAQRKNASESLPAQDAFSPIAQCWNALEETAVIMSHLALRIGSHGAKST